MIAQHQFSKSLIAVAAGCFTALAFALPAGAADKTPSPRIVQQHVAPSLMKQADKPGGRSAKSAPDQILCMAGCDSLNPIIVQERPAVPYVEPAAGQWVEQTWGVHCADGIGCIARDVLPPPSRTCCHSYSSTVVIYHRGYPYWR
jgi:hypothetical protein